jgi:PHD/YefM family antitoxin component YafN of YafNO toxin-antitoxin module
LILLIRVIKLAPLVTPMKVATVKEFKLHATRYLRNSDPVLITRRGQVAGFLLPVEDASELPFELRRELLVALTAELKQKARNQGLTEEKVLAQFEATRATGRGRQSVDRRTPGRRRR